MTPDRDKRQRNPVKQEWRFIGLIHDRQKKIIWFPRCSHFGETQAPSKELDLAKQVFAGEKAPKKKVINSLTPSWCERLVASE